MADDKLARWPEKWFPEFVQIQRIKNALAELRALLASEVEPVGYITPRDLARIQSLEPWVPSVKVWAEPDDNDIALYLAPPARESVFCLGRLMTGETDYEPDFCDMYEASEGRPCKGECAYTDAVKKALAPLAPWIGDLASPESKPEAEPVGWFQTCPNGHKYLDELPRPLCECCGPKVTPHVRVTSQPLYLHPPSREREAIAERISVAVHRILPPQLRYHVETDEALEEIYNAADAILATEDGADALIEAEQGGTE